MLTLVDRTDISKGTKIPLSVITNTEDILPLPDYVLIDEVFKGKLVDGVSKELFVGIIFRHSLEKLKYSSFLARVVGSENLGQVSFAYAGAYIPASKYRERDCNGGGIRLKEAGL